MYHSGLIDERKRKEERRNGNFYDYEGADPVVANSVTEPSVIAA